MVRWGSAPFEFKTRRSKAGDIPPRSALPITPARKPHASVPGDLAAGMEHLASARIVRSQATAGHPAARWLGWAEKLGRTHEPRHARSRPAKGEALPRRSVAMRFIAAMS